MILAWNLQNMTTWSNLTTFIMIMITKFKQIIKKCDKAKIELLELAFQPWKNLDWYDIFI